MKQVKKTNLLIYVGSINHKQTQDVYYFGIKWRKPTIQKFSGTTFGGSSNCHRNAFRHLPKKRSNPTILLQWQICRELIGSTSGQPQVNLEPTFTIASEFYTRKKSHNPKSPGLQDQTSRLVWKYVQTNWPLFYLPLRGNYTKTSQPSLTLQASGEISSRSWVSSRTKMSLSPNPQVGQVIALHPALSFKARNGWRHIAIGGVDWWPDSETSGVQYSSCCNSQWNWSICNLCKTRKWAPSKIWPYEGDYHYSRAVCFWSNIARHQCHYVHQWFSLCMSFSLLGDQRKHFTDTPFIAVTATAIPSSQANIYKFLQMTNAEIFYRHG